MRGRGRKEPAVTQRTEGEPRAAGWYPDPGDPQWMRHWDGRRWGDEHRPRPGWAPPAPVTGEAGAASRPGRRRWLLFAGVAGALALSVVAFGATLGDGPDLPPRTVFDEVFTTRADAVCLEVLPPIRRDRPEPGPEGGGTAEELTPRIERAADGLDGLVASLDGIEVTPAEQAEVDRWLTEWRAYIAVGRAYAVTLGAGDTTTGAEVSAETGRIGKRLFGFAHANAMPSCVP